MKLYQAFLDVHDDKGETSDSSGDSDNSGDDSVFSKKNNPNQKAQEVLEKKRQKKGRERATSNKGGEGQGGRGAT